MITVVNKYKHTPTNNDIYIGRGSALGNPFTSIQTGNTKAKFVCNTREESIENFREYIIQELESNQQIKNAFNDIYIMARNGDVNLVCFCKPKSCHGDIIKQIIEEKL